jgi:hypothetical protein
VENETHLGLFLLLQLILLSTTKKKKNLFFPPKRQKKMGQVVFPHARLSKFADCREIKYSKKASLNESLFPKSCGGAGGAAPLPAGLHVRRP